MRYVSLFSGIEAATVAWEPLGWEPVAFCESDPFPSAVLAHRWPYVPNLGDIREVDWSEWRGAIDLVVGGSPCQSFSIAGGRESLSGESRLMWEYVRAVGDIQPRWLLWENVPGVLSTRDDAFGCLLDALQECGYVDLAWRVLDSQFARVPVRDDNGAIVGWVGPVAQRRRRVFLVGHLGAGGRSGAVLFESDCLRGDNPTSAKKRQELSEAAGRCAERDRGRVMCITDDNGKAAVGTDIAGTLKRGGSVPIIATAAPEYVVRKLTPIECERLQGFPDNHTDVPWRGSEHAPDTKRYKAIGNSMAVPVMRMIGERIETVDKETEG